MLHDELKIYEKKIQHRFHMPGHHGLLSPPYDGLAKMDITEVPGYDNLREPTGILLEEEAHAAEIFGASQSLISVNGSSGLLMAGIFYLAGCKKKVLMPREAHISIYQGVSLRGLCPIYYASEIEKESNLSLGPSLTDFEEALALHGADCDFCIINAPTYMGFSQHVKRMVSKAQKKGLKVLVDEAHGAHFPFFESLPRTAVLEGADVVVQSVHKMLPFPTQLALAHLNGDQDKKAMGRALALFQTTSPSYILLGAFSKSLDLMGQKEASFYEEALCRMEDFYKAIEGSCFEVSLFRQKEHQGEKDPFKIILDTQRISIDGFFLSELLRKDYGIQLEAFDHRYGLGLSSPFQRKDALFALSKALWALHHQYAEGRVKTDAPLGVDYFRKRKETKIPLIFSAGSLKKMPLKDSVGKRAGTFIVPYPPGIPLLCPGEEIEKEDVEQLRMLKSHGVQVLGLQDGIEIII